MRSRWLFLVLTLGVAGTCVALGLWQLRRHSVRRQANLAAVETRAAPPRTLPGSALAPEIVVSATGTYDLDHEIVLRGRAHDGAPGIELATPLRITGTDTALIVIRGFVPSDDATSVDLRPLREEGERTVRGVTFRIDTTPTGGGRAEHRGAMTALRLNTHDLATLPYPVYPFALWQAKDSGMTGFPIRTGAPGLDEGPHFNYMLQWFAFALIFAGGGIAFAMQRRPSGTTAP